MRTINFIPFVLVILLLAFIYLINYEHKKELAKECKLAYELGRQSQIEDNIKHQVMDKSRKWYNEFKLAGEK